MDKIAAEMDTVLIHLGKPHGKIDWAFILSGWRRQLRHASDVVENYSRSKSHIGGNH
jgi:hypothetical protein